MNNKTNNQINTQVNDKTTIINQAKANFRKFVKTYNSPRGWLLIMLVFLFGILAAAAITNPLLKTSVQFSDTLFEENIRRSQQILLTTNSPIRNYVINELYDRVQKQLVDHLAKAGGSNSYMCQNVEIPAASSGSSDSKLENQFGLCSPEKLFEGMDGDTNQTIDFNTAFKLKLRPELDEDNKNAIKNLMAQNKNSYDYTLRTMFTRQELLQYEGVGKPRTELYHWLTRADVIATTNGGNKGDIRQPLVIYYDVTLINEFYPNQFYGAGGACDRRILSEGIFNCPIADVQANGGIIETCTATLIKNPDGSYAPIDEFTNTTPTGPCVLSSSSPTLEVMICPGEGGTSIRLLKFKSVRPRFGCASVNSLNSGKSKTEPDPKGYSFILTVRTVSIGSSYN